MTTTTFRPRFATTRSNGIVTYVRCMGTNHRDEGQRGRCTTCLADIVRVVRPDGTKRLYDVNGRYNAADNYVYDFACWSHTHTCDQAIAAAVQAEREAKIATGEVTVIGQLVTVIRGRKVAKGTEGRVFWVGDDTDYYGNPFAKVGIKTLTGDTHFIKADYCKATSTIPVVTAEEAAAADPANADEYLSGSDYVAPKPRTTGSHADCTHEATKSARAACRKARNA